MKFLSNFIILTQIEYYLKHKLYTQIRIIKCKIGSSVDISIPRLTWK